MADIPLSSVAGAPSAAFTTMPISSTDPASLWIKAGASTAHRHNAAAYYTAISTAGAAGRQWLDAQLEPVADTTEQQVVNLSGSGVLTCVHTASNTSAATHTIRVEIDGAPAIVYSASTAAGDLLIAGYVSPWQESSTLGSGINWGFNSAPNLTINTPVASLMLSDYGLKFKTSLRVTVQCSVNQQSSASNKAVALYTTFIPKGAV